MSTETRPGLDELAGCVERLVTWLRRSTAVPGYSVTSRLTLARLQADGPARISDLARLEGVTQPAMTGLVNRLEAEGLVTRSADPTDARAALVALTGTGRAFVESRRAERVRVLTARVERLSEADRAAILAALPALDRLSNLS
ncbi:MAG TPA: MarR family transcriptional regulator [Mycobacteriales bacterium]|nr:MarR family transcriptional regulator [Mycobacteriales bacterium]